MTNADEHATNGFMNETKRLLGAVEKAQALTNVVYAFNVVVALHLENGPGKEIIAKAAGNLCARHPILSACIKKERGQFLFERPPRPGPVPVERIKRENETSWHKTVENALNRPIDFENGPLFRIDLVSDPETSSRSEMILTFHHAVMDGTSGANLLDELLTLCSDNDLAAMGSEHPPTLFYPPAETFFPPSYRGIRKTCHTLLYLLRMMADEFAYRARTVKIKKAPIHETGSGRILPCTMSQETSRLLLKRARKERITVNRLFDAALLQSANRHIYHEISLPMRFFTFADLRPFLKPPVPARITGSYFSMMRFTAMVRPSTPLAVLAGQIQQQVYRALKRGDKYCACLLSADIMKIILKTKSARMGHTALSHMGGIDLKPRYGEIRVKDLRVFTSNFVLGPEYTAQTRLFNGRFNWDILYLDSDMDQARAWDIADDIFNTLTAFAKGD